MKLNKVVTETNGMTCLQYHRFVCRLLITLRGAPVAQSIKRWTCDWKVAGSNPGLEGHVGLFPYFLLHVPSLSFERDIKPWFRVSRLMVPAR